MLTPSDGFRPFHFEEANPNPTRNFRYDLLQEMPKMSQYQSRKHNFSFTDHGCFQRKFKRKMRCLLGEELRLQKSITIASNDNLSLLFFNI